MDIGAVLIIAIIVGLVFGFIGTLIAENKGVSLGLGFFLSAFLGPIGLIITALLSPSPTGTQPKPKKVLTEPANLADADYRIWLTEEYSITKNDVLGQFYCSNRLFDTADEAVAHAHELETQKCNAEREKQQAEKERQEKNERERRAQWEEAERLRLERQKRNRPYVIAGWLIVLVATGLGIFTFYSREQARIAAIPQKIEDQGYAVFSDEIRSRNGAYRVIGTDVPFTGIGRAFYRSGQISKETNFVDGQQHGLRRTWIRDGQLDYEGNWVNGVERDSVRRYFRSINGQLWDETKYVNGEKHGLNHMWDESGEEFNFSPWCYRDGVHVSDWREGDGACP